MLTITYPLVEPNRDDIVTKFVLDLAGALGGMREVAEAAASGLLPATIGRHYTLDEGPQACVDFVSRHTTGKLVVTV